MENNIVTRSLDILGLIINRKFNEGILVKEETKNSLTIALLDILFYSKFDIRFYVINSDVQLQSIWEYVRGNENILDIVMGSMSELHMKLSAGPEKKESSFNILITEISSALTVNYDQGIMDNDTYERLPVDRNEIYTLLTNNPWLVIIYLLSILDLPEGIVETKTVLVK